MGADTVQQEPCSATRRAVAACFAEVACEQQLNLAPLADDLPLSDCGLDSLCLAIVLTRLEDELGLDPLAADPGADFPATYGELVALCERALA